MVFDNLSSAKAPLGRIERFRGLIAIQEKVSAADGDLQSVMDALVHEFSVMPQATGIVVELRDGDQLYYAAASGTSSGLDGLRLPLNASLSGMSVLKGAPLSCEDSETDSRVNRMACRRVGLRSMIVVPIPHQGQTVGVLKYYSDRPSAFAEEDMLLAHLLVGPIAVGLSKVAEGDAKRAQQELQALVELKQEFVATVSHELRTPLTAIAGSLGLLENGAAGTLPDKAANLVSIARKNSERLKRLVHDLLDIEKLESGSAEFKFAEVDLTALVEETVEQNRPFAVEAGVQLIGIAPSFPVRAWVDSGRLVQAITNLVSNAAKFSPAGGKVVIELSQVADQARIRVSDEGPGIPADFKKRLFERFAQAAEGKSATNLPGTGLGLAITKSILDQMKGQVRLAEDVPQGAAFDILIPIAPRQRAKTSAA